MELFLTEIFNTVHNYSWRIHNFPQRKLTRLLLFYRYHIEICPTVSMTEVFLVCELSKRNYTIIIKGLMQAKGTIQQKHDGDLGSLTLKDAVDISNTLNSAVDNSQEPSKNAG